MASTPIDVFVNKERSARIWFALFFVLLALSALERQRLVGSLDARREYVVVDPSGDYYLPASRDFEGAKELHAAQTRLAMEAIFDRSPEGSDHPRRLRLILGREALSKALRMFEQEKPEFAAKELHQKVEFGPVEVLQVRDLSVLTGVEGQLIRTGQFRDRTVVEVLGVKARFHFVENLRFGSNGRFPTVAVEFDSETWPVAPSDAQAGASGASGGKDQTANPQEPL